MGRTSRLQFVALVLVLALSTNVNSAKEVEFAPEAQLVNGNDDITADGAGSTPCPDAWLTAAKSMSCVHASTLARWGRTPVHTQHSHRALACPDTQATAHPS